MPPRPPQSPTFMPGYDEMTRGRGRRRNFYHERFEHPHRFALGTRVFMQTPAMRIPVGPLYVVECCKALQPRGPPQYILQPCVEGDNSRWLLAAEVHMYRVDENDNPIPLDDDENDNNNNDNNGNNNNGNNNN